MEESPMKLILIIAAGVLLATMVGWAIYDSEGFRHATVGYSQDEQNRAAQQLQTAILESTRSLDADLLEAEVKLVTLRHGESTGARYRMCHTYPPTTKAHKLECERLDKQKARDDANDTKHPW
jgi:hypothetical protein